MHNVIFENGGGEIFVSINTLLHINVALERKGAQPVICLLSLVFNVLRVDAVYTWCLSSLQALDVLFDFWCCEISG